MEINYSRQREEKPPSRPTYEHWVLVDIPLLRSQKDYGRAGVKLWSWCVISNASCIFYCRKPFLWGSDILLVTQLDRALQRQIAHKNKPFRNEQGQQLCWMEQMNQVIAWLNFPITWHSIGFNSLRWWQLLTLCCFLRLSNSQVSTWFWRIFSYLENCWSSTRKRLVMFCCEILKLLRCWHIWILKSWSQDCQISEEIEKLCWGPSPSRPLELIVHGVELANYWWH